MGIFAQSTQVKRTSFSVWGPIVVMAKSPDPSQVKRQANIVQATPMSRPKGLASDAAASQVKARRLLQKWVAASQVKARRKSKAAASQVQARRLLHKLKRGGCLTSKKWAAASQVKAPHPSQTSQVSTSQKPPRYTISFLQKWASQVTAPRQAAARFSIKNQIRLLVL